MSYKLIYTKRALKDIQQLDNEIKQRLKKAIEKYVENPLYFAQKLTNSELGTYRFRVGNLRVIFDIDDDKIVVLRVGYRRDIYRK